MFSQEIKLDGLTSETCNRISEKLLCDKKNVSITLHLQNNFTVNVFLFSIKSGFRKR